MSEIVATRKYVWKIPGKIYFVTLKINRQKQYKLSIDIRNKPIGSTSNDINDYKERDNRLVSGWITYKDNLSKAFQDISGDTKFMRLMSEIAFDYNQITHTMPQFSHAALFKRKYFAVPYPVFEAAVHDEKFRCNEIVEFWLSGNDKMEIVVTKLRTYYRNLAIGIENDIMKINNDADDFTRVKENLELEYPMSDLTEWVLEEIIIFYKPRIYDEIVNIISVIDLAKLITSYVLS